MEKTDLSPTYFGLDPKRDLITTLNLCWHHLPSDNILSAPHTCILISSEAPGYLSSHYQVVKNIFSIFSSKSSIFTGAVDLENQLSPCLLLLVFFWHSNTANTAPSSCFFLTKQSKFLPGTMLHLKVHWLAGIKPQEIMRFTFLYIILSEFQFSTVQLEKGLSGQK